MESNNIIVNITLDTSSIEALREIGEVAKRLVELIESFSPSATVL